MSRILPRLFCVLSLVIILGACGRGASPAASNADAASPSSDEQSQAALTVQIYTPTLQSIAAVPSTLIYGEREAILIDAQFASGDAWKLAEVIERSGKTLTTIYVSHYDPAFYFGLDALRASFPNAKILATPQTVARIRANAEKDQAMWKPQLQENAPVRIVVPDPMEGDTLMLEGQELRIVGLDGPTPERTFVWIPAIKTVVAGVTVTAGEHVWMADTRTPQSRADWLATLQRIEALQPERVIPGHAPFGAPQNMDAVRFTADYVRNFDQAAEESKNADELIDIMEQHYPQLIGYIVLEISAKAVKNEIHWQ